MRNIGLVYDPRDDSLAEGYSDEDVAEFDSESTIAALADAIRADGHEVDRVGRGRALARRLADGERWDLVFTIAEGTGKGIDGRSGVDSPADLHGIVLPLLARAEADIRARAGRMIVVETSLRADYEPARRFYERHGYCRSGVVSDFYEPSDDRLVYIRTLET